MQVFMIEKLTVLLLIVIALNTANPTSSTKVDATDASIKCGDCPCVNPCSQQIPPPPPPPPLPPPSYGICPPPPPPRFVYMTSPPGNLYPTDDPFNLQIYSNAPRNSFLDLVSPFLLVVCLVCQLLVSYLCP